MVNLGELNIQGIYLGETEIVSAYLGETQVYTNSTIPNYLKFEALEDNSTVTYIPSTVSTAEYSTDGINWQSFDNETVTLEYTGDIIYVKGTLSGNQSSSNYAKFVMEGAFKAYGDISTLLFNGQEKVKDLVHEYCCYGLFEGCSGLLDISKLKLPATNLKRYCYYTMFQNCTSLPDAYKLKLPAMTLERSCYNSMFKNCTSLVNAPKLPATTLALQCYQSMFYNCTKLVNAPELPATTLVEQCYNSMFYNCTNLVSAPELPATTLVNQCYKYMFNKCTNLVTAPVLPATTLAYLCYYYMFQNCSSLSEITTYVTEWNEAYCTDWVSGVAENGTFYNFGLAEIPTGNNGIPTGWTEHTSLDD